MKLAIYIYTIDFMQVEPSSFRRKRPRNITCARDNDPFCEKTINVLAKMDFILAGPHIQAIQISCQLCSNVDIDRILGPIKFCKWSIKISNGPLKFGYLNVIWAIGPF